MISRRENLKVLASGAALTFTGAVILATTSCGPTEVPAREVAPAHDRMLDLANRYIDANVRLNASDLTEDEDVLAFIAEHIDPLRDELIKRPPRPTTMEGVRAALALAARSIGQGDNELAEPLVAAALAYMGGRAV